MKKFLLLMAACITMPFVFTSCDEDDATDLLGTVVGSMKIEIGGKTSTFTGVGYFQEDGKTYIATANGENIVGVKLNGTTAQSYTLGIVSDNVLSALLSGDLNLNKFDNIMAFRPNGDEIYVVVSGTFTVTSVSDNLNGTFSGNAIKASYVKSLYDGGTTDYAELLKIITGSSAETVKVSGSLKATETSAIKDLFSGVFSK